MQLVLGEGRRILSSSSWPKCFHCLGQSQASWTRRQSSGWLSATCTCAPLPVRETRRGALYWRATTTATKVSKKWTTTVWDVTKEKPGIHLFSKPTESLSGFLEPIPATVGQRVRPEKFAIHHRARRSIISFHQVLKIKWKASQVSSLFTLQVTCYTN